MKIVFIIDHFGNGGAERVVSVLASSMVQKSHNVSVIVSKDIMNYTLDKSIKYYIALDKSNYKVVRRINKVKAIRKFLNDINPDVIFAFGYYMNLYAVIATWGLRKFKLIISERTDPRSEPVNKIARRIRDILYKKADILVCQTEQAKQYFSKIQQKKCVIIPNPIISNLPPKYTGERKKTIVTACRLHKQKNIPLLLKAFEEIQKKYPEYRLIIYGDGNLRNELIDLSISLGIFEKVSFPGFEKNLHDKIVDAGMYVSSSDYEGISNSMLEVMGMGLPVICTDCPVGGASMVIKNGINGLLVPVGNCKKLIAAMEQVICNPIQAEQYGRNALYVNEEFNVNKICDKWMALI